MVSRGEERRRRAASVLGALIIHAGVLISLVHVDGGSSTSALSTADGETPAISVDLVAMPGGAQAVALPQPPDQPQPAPTTAPEAAVATSPTPAPRAKASTPSPAVEASAGRLAEAADGGASSSAADAVRSDYQRRLMTHITAFKRYPKGLIGAHGVVQLVFAIDRAGGVRGVWVVKSSGVSQLDAAAVETVRRAQPVPQIPDSLPGLLTVPLAVVFDGQGDA